MCTAGQTASERRAARRDEIEYGKGAECRGIVERKP